MIRSCKNIDITDPDTVYPWVLECLERHRRRYDFRRLLCTIGGLSQAEYTDCLTDRGLLEKPARLIAIEAIRRIKAKSLKLPPVKIRERQDKSSLKIRLIGTEDAMQQVFDHIAVYAAMPIWKRRIVPQQASSLRQRGPTYGAAMISKWLRQDNKAASWAYRHQRKYTRKCRYFVKLDIQKCYPSMRADVFLHYFSHDCGNRDLLWLWQEILTSHQANGYQGFMIGALPSQWAAQYIMSFLYRYVMELHTKRREKSVKWVSHCLMYMDDILLTGSNRKNLKAAAQGLTVYAKNMFGLTVKPNWQICKQAETPVDMMGFLIHPDGNVTVRSCIFLRTRRVALRVSRKRTMALRQARRLTAYKGYFYQRRRKGRMPVPLKSERANRKYDLRKQFDMAALLCSRKERKCCA